MSRWSAFLLGVLGSTACYYAEGFACRDASECSLAGEPGLCLAGNCAYPDLVCASGYRYAEGLHNALAGECASEDDVPAAPSDESDESSGSSSGPDAPEATRIGSTSSSGSNDESTSSGDMPNGGSTEADSGDASSDADDGASSSSTGSPIVCDDSSCAECFACVIEPGQACAMFDSACDLGMECRMSATCMQSCAIKGICFDDCCGDYDSDDVEMAHELHACRAEACPTSCPDLPEPYCS